MFSCLPDMPPECCSACGFSCKELAARILRGEAKREDCVISDGRISLEIDGQEITMVPFVQKILYNAVAGVVKELDGYRENGEIIIKIKGK